MERLQAPSKSASRPNSWTLPAALISAPAPPAPPPREVPDLSTLKIPVTLNAPVRGFMEFFQGRARGIYARWLARMGRYEQLMGGILERHGLPRELLFLCMIESGFRPDAVSKAAAVGPWQFIRSAGDTYGLRYDDWVDERRDPEKSTEAAARFLKTQYKRFKSWPLAMAAYNAGPGGALKAMRRANSNDFWRLSAQKTLPTQASLYVPKIMAAMIIGQDPARYGFGDVIPEPPLHLLKISVPGGLDLKQIAKRSGLSFQKLSELNPELRRGFTPPDPEGYSLNIPSSAKAALERTLRSLQKPGLLQEHRARFGERFKEIARHYGISLRTLRRLNDMAGEPQPGQIILVPKQKRPPKPPEELQVFQDPGLKFQCPPGYEEHFFPLRYPMDLSEVAGAFGISAGQIAQWNGLDPRARLQRGLALRLFLPPQLDKSRFLLLKAEQVTVVVPGSDTAKRSLRQAQRGRRPGSKRIIHSVRKGESLWSIARKYRCSVKEIRAENGLSRRSGLNTGMKLKIPQLRRPRAQGKARKRKAKPNARGRSYKVRKGDSLARIAKRFGVKLGALKRRNGFNKKSRATIRPGQILKIP